MSEQSPNLRSLVSLVRRERRRVILVVAVGAVLGAVIVFLGRPPAYQSTSQVLLPTAPTNSSGQSTRDSATEVRVASSDVVLGPAGRAMSPPLSVTQVDHLTTVTAPTPDVIQIVAKGSTAVAAEQLARAMAQAEVAYQALAASSLTSAQQTALAARGDALQKSLNSIRDEIKATQARINAEQPGAAQHPDLTALADLTAQQADLVLQIDALKQTSASAQLGGEATVIETASRAKRTEPVLWYSLAILGGALTGLALAVMVLAGTARRDRRLRTRDDIADALGSTVIGSVHSRPQRTVAGWTALLATYEPSITDTWSFRQVLHHVGLGELTVRGGSEPRTTPARARVLTLVTLSDDPRALAVGPQLASHAASLGIRTRFCAGQGHDAAASLWSAMASLRKEAEVRPALVVGNRSKGPSDVDLIVRLVVVDQRHPQFLDRPPNGVSLLAISSGAATPDDLARAAVAAYESGAALTGVIVADPDPLDHTTGRLLLQERAKQGPLPTRITGVIAPPSPPDTREQGSGQ